MGSKLISSSLDNDRLYIECECISELMYVDKLHSNEIIIGFITINSEYKELLGEEFIFTSLKQFNDFVNLCEKALECIRDNFYLEAGDLRLYVEYCRDVCLFNVSLKNISGNKLISEIYIKENAFEDFIYELKRMKSDIVKSLCKVKVGNKIRILTKEEMRPNFIDEIGRLHFDLGDGSDIIFNKDMEKYCGAEGKVTVVNPFIDLNGDVKFTMSLSTSDPNDYSDIWLYTFTEDMVKIIE